MSAKERRRATFSRGRIAEGLALGCLVLKGYRPLAWRFSASGGEIDLVVARGRTIAFVEVKARAALEDAQGASDGRKRRRFSRAVRAWVSRHPWAMERTLRADAVFIAPGRYPRHLEAAFEIEGF